MPAIPEIACLRVLTSTKLLKRAMTTSALDKPVETTKTQCSVESSSLILVAGKLV